MASLSDLRIPEINWCLEAGIHANKDPVLPNHEKLPVLFTGGVPSPDAMQYAIIWFYRRISKEPWAIGAVYALFTGKLLHKIGDIPDGDWKKVSIPERRVTAGEAAIINAASENYRKGLDIVLSTKVNWWLTSHHVGTSRTDSGYVRKIFNSHFRRDPNQHEISVIRSLGRYASTKAVLKAAEIEDIEPTTCYDDTDGVNFTLPQEHKLRFKTLPSGTRRLAICREATMELLKNEDIAKRTPGLSDLAKEVADSFNLISANPAKYHMKAEYLTGQPRARYDDSQMELSMGRLGSFITVMHPESKIARSPYFAVRKINKYDDYDFNYYAFLRKMKNKSDADNNEKDEGPLPDCAFELEKIRRKEGRGGMKRRF